MPRIAIDIACMGCLVSTSSRIIVPDTSQTQVFSVEVLSEYYFKWPPLRITEKQLVLMPGIKKSSRNREEASEI
jgi:hypothetical protein